MICMYKERIIIQLFLQETGPPKRHKWIFTPSNPSEAYLWYASAPGCTGRSWWVSGGPMVGRDSEMVNTNQANQSWRINFDVPSGIETLQVEMPQKNGWFFQGNLIWKSGNSHCHLWWWEGITIGWNQLIQLRTLLVVRKPHNRALSYSPRTCIPKLHSFPRTCEAPKLTAGKCGGSEFSTQVKRSKHQ